MKAGPALFIGSSVEGLNIAYAIQENLDFDCEPMVWPQGVFNPSSSALVDLYAFSRKAEFAVFVFTPDDIVHLRGAPHPVARDNVIFELGLFIGALGPRRCFFVVPRGSSLHVPSDLLGVEPLTYLAQRSDGNLRAALGPACNRIRQAIRSEPAAIAVAAADPAPLESPEVLAKRYVEFWEGVGFANARERLRQGIGFNVVEDETGEDTNALLHVFNFLNSVADGVLAGQIDEAVARHAFADAMAGVWKRARGYLVPPGADRSEAWDPLPPIGQLVAKWSTP